MTTAQAPLGSWPSSGWPDQHQSVTDLGQAIPPVHALTACKDIRPQGAKRTWLLSFRKILSSVEGFAELPDLLYGVGPVVAATIIGHVVDVRRYPTRHHFATANGTAPIPASSGRTIQHRLNRGGNRQLNRAIYTIAITQIRADTEGRAYYQRKRAEGKTSREALRCIKRRLSDLIYRTLRTDLANAAQQTTVSASPHEPGARW